MSNLSVKKLPMSTEGGRFETDDDDFREEVRNNSQTLLVTQARKESTYEDLRVAAQVGPGKNLLEEYEALQEAEKNIRKVISDTVTEHFQGKGGSWSIGPNKFTVAKSVAKMEFDDDVLQAHEDLIEALEEVEVDGTPVLRLAVSPSAMQEAIRRGMVSPDVLEDYGVLKWKSRRASLRITQKSKK